MTTPALFVLRAGGLGDTYYWSPEAGGQPIFGCQAALVGLTDEVPTLASLLYFSGPIWAASNLNPSSIFTTTLMLIPTRRNLPLDYLGLTHVVGFSACRSTDRSGRLDQPSFLWTQFTTGIVATPMATVAMGMSIGRPDFERGLPLSAMAATSLGEQLRGYHRHNTRRLCRTNPQIGGHCLTASVGPV